MSVFDLRIGTCGCCRPPASATPEPLANRPALSAIRYRVGTYPTFRQAMIELIPVLSERLAVTEGLASPPLQQWTSRDSDDYGMAVIEMWATICDILTFYQERYANRAWLRTAEHHEAVRRLAALLGYRLKPGVAASTHLAVTLEAGSTLLIPPGLRAQSVPGEGETPQKFEVDAPLEAESTLNHVPIFGSVLTVTPLTAGRRIETLEPTSPVPSPGDRVVLFTDGGDPLEQRIVDALSVTDQRTLVRWSRALNGTHEQAFVRGRALRVFGHSAPATSLVATPSGSSGTFLEWEEASTDFTYRTLFLDGTVDGIEVGSRVLIDVAGVPHLRTVEESGPATRTVGPLTGAATELHFGTDVDHDVRTTVVYELLTELQFQSWELSREAIPSGSTTVYVPYPEVPAIVDGRLLVLDDEAHDPLLSVAAGDAVPFSPDTEAEFLEVTLAEPTTRDLDHKSAFLLGNIVPASHGQTVAGEILGDGDAAATLQAFPLAKSPVTHVSDALVAGGARSTVQILVDGVRWSERSGLYGAGTGEQIYVTGIDDDAHMTVGFGDGQTGAVLPTGRANVTATYRQGLGHEGNVRGEQITTALDRPTGLKEVVNPLPAAGGVDPETMNGARENAPNTVRTFERAVSLTDFADLAREYTGVAKALATWVWDGQERVVHVTVGGEDGQPLGALSELRAYLDLRRDPNRTLLLGEYRPVPFVVTVAVEVEPNHRNEDVRVAVVDAITAYFAYDSRVFGQAVHLSDIYAVIHDVAGVVSAVISELRYKQSEDAAAHPAPRGPLSDRLPFGDSPLIDPFPVFFPRPPPLPAAPLIHAPILSARHDPATGTVVPAELAVLESNADLTVTASGGLTS